MKLRKTQKTKQNPTTTTKLKKKTNKTKNGEREILKAVSGNPSTLARGISRRNEGEILKGEKHHSDAKRVVGEIMVDSLLFC